MLKIIFFGSPEIAVPSLQALHEAGHQILAVVTQPDRRSGRGQKVTPPPIKVAAENLHLPVLQPEKVKTEEFLAILKSYAADLFCVVAYGRILTPAVLALPAYGCVNEHFSLLPQYRGASCIAYPLINGDDETGVTSMLMDEGLDSGPILLQWSETILPEDTAGSLAARLTSLGAQQLVKTVEGLEQGNLQPVPQNPDAASFAPLLKKEHGNIDWTQSAEKIFNLYRGLTPWPGVYSFLEGKRVIFTRMKLEPEDPSMLDTPGMLIFSPMGKAFVLCGHGQVEILSVKIEGKREMNAEEFRLSCQGLPKRLLTS